MILRGAAAEENANVSLLPSTESAAAAFAAAAAARHEGLYTHVVDRAQGTLTGVQIKGSGDATAEEVGRLSFLPSNEKRAELLMQYDNPMFPFSPSGSVSYSLSVNGITDIACEPTKLESTSLMLAFGGPDGRLLHAHHAQQLV
jgi:hypothetical protein